MKIIQIHKALSAPIGDLITYRALPTGTLEYLDPFLFLNHHGPQVYAPMNSGLPFGPHPHRGIETVTFILEGDILHKDNAGHESIITRGGVQWMTAGSGLIHAEISSDKFKQSGGPLEILQLWLNLPSVSKMAKPFYRGLQHYEIPQLDLDDGKVEIKLISGHWRGEKGAFISGIGVMLSLIHIKQNGKMKTSIPEGNTIFFYVIKGMLMVQGQNVAGMHLVEFDKEGGELYIESGTDSIFLFGYAQPLNEPVVFHGPFVMNTEQEIIEAYADYRNGLFGTWKD